MTQFSIAPLTIVPTSLFLAFIATACSSETQAADATIGCKGDPRAEVYAANTKKAGKNGNFTFELVSSDPAPPAKGNNDWKVQVLDAQGNPVSDAKLTVTPVMPDHGHGTAVVPTITAASDGYAITPLYLFMAGLWQVTIVAESNGTSDSVAFSYCIEG